MKKHRNCWIIIYKNNFNILFREQKTESFFGLKSSFAEHIWDPTLGTPKLAVYADQFKLDFQVSTNMWKQDTGTRVQPHCMYQSSKPRSRNQLLRNDSNWLIRRSWRTTSDKSTLKPICYKRLAFLATKSQVIGCGRGKRGQSPL